MQSITNSNSFKYAIINVVLLLTAYITAWCLTCRYSFMLILLGLFFFPFCLIVVIISIVFCITGRKKYRQSYIPFCINIVIAAVIYLLPSINRSKAYLKGTYSLKHCKACNCSPDLYTEYYCAVGGGYMTTDVNAIYLTDKKNFRVYVGYYDTGDEFIEIKCIGDKITTTKTTSRGISTYWTNAIVLEKKTFSITDLKREHKFE